MAIAKPCRSPSGRRYWLSNCACVSKARFHRGRPAMPPVGDLDFPRAARSNLWRRWAARRVSTGAGPNPEGRRSARERTLANEQDHKTHPRSPHRAARGFAGRRARSGDDHRTSACSAGFAPPDVAADDLRRAGRGHESVFRQCHPRGADGGVFVCRHLRRSAKRTRPVGSSTRRRSRSASTL